MFEIALTQMQDLAFDPVELHELIIGQFLKAIKVPLEGISFLPVFLRTIYFLTKWKQLPSSFFSA